MRSVLILGGYAERLGRGGDPTLCRRLGLRAYGGQADGAVCARAVDLGEPEPAPTSQEDKPCTA